MRWSKWAQSPGCVCPGHRNKLSGDVWRGRRERRQGADRHSLHWTNKKCYKLCPGIGRSCEGKECRRTVCLKWTKCPALFTENMSQMVDGGLKEMRFKGRGNDWVKRREISIIYLSGRNWGERGMTLMDKKVRNLLNIMKLIHSHQVVKGPDYLTLSNHQPGNSADSWLNLKQITLHLTRANVTKTSHQHSDLPGPLNKRTKQ